MTRHSGGQTINQGGAPDPDKERPGEFDIFDIAGNVAEKGGEPSPAKRARGETSGAEPASAVDLDLAHDRAS
jgi:hypothetical protein